MIKEESLEFLESSWCNRNAQWSTFVFTGYHIDRPLLEMAHVAEWKADLRHSIEHHLNTVYLVTVPRLYGTNDTPKTFFYNTHFFTLQLLFDSEEEGSHPRFKIFAGFARHYRMIDYLQDWDINVKIEDNHRLRINRTTWAVESFGEHAMFEDFLPNLERMMDEINTHGAWTRTANDIHADLFYADKFKDMIFLQSHGLTKPRQEQAKRYSLNSLLVNRAETENNGKLENSRLHLAEMKDGNNIQFGVLDASSVDSTRASPTMDSSTASSTALHSHSSTLSASDTEPKRLALDQVPPEGFYVPLARLDSGDYQLTIRKYHYKHESCHTHAQIIKRTCYPRDPKKYPALPFQITPEDYGTYRERGNIPKRKFVTESMDHDV